MQYAFVINSLFYCIQRVQGYDCKDLKVMTQLQRIKTYFVKVDKEFNREKYQQKKREAKQQPIQRIVHQTVKMNQRIEQKQNESKLHAKKAAEDFMSASSYSDAEEPQKKIDSLLKKRKGGSINTGAAQKLQERMHGATVVPEPAYLKLKKLVKK